MRISAIHPRGCGCTDCGDGASRPLDQATGKQVIKLLTGRIPNQSGHYLRLDVQVGIAPPGDDRGSGPLSVTVTALDLDDTPLDGCHWDLGAEALPLLATHLL